MGQLNFPMNLQFTRVLISETYFDTVVFGKVLQLLYRSLKFLEAKPVVEITGFSNTFFFIEIWEQNRSWTQSQMCL